MTIRRRIFLVLSAVAIGSAGIAATTGYRTADAALEERSFELLTAVRELKGREVETYLHRIESQVVTFSESRMVIDAMRSFRDAFAARDASGADAPSDEADVRLRRYYQEQFLSRLEQSQNDSVSFDAFWPDPPARSLQSLYIADNPFETGSKHLLDAATDGSSYSRTHAIYHPLFRNYLERFGYYDIFLVDRERARIVYTVFKEVDYATSLLDGPYRNSNFARVVREARESGSRDFVALADFEPYAPSYGAMASFIASPIFDGDEMLGVLVFQMPVDRINETMTSRGRWTDVGLGRTGEVYLVGSDRTLRSEPRLLLEDQASYLDALSAAGVPRGTVAAIARDGSAIGRHPSHAPEITRALDGETGTARSVGYRGEPVHMAFRPLTFRGLRWAVVSEMAEDEAQAPALALRDKVLLEVLVVVLAIAGVAVLFARSLTRPLADLSRRASGLAAGDLETEIPVRGDAEIAELARSFEVMRSSIAEHQTRQQRAIEALATPLIPLHDHVLVAPLVGELDDHRIAAISTTLVEGVHRSGARVAILDLTGVPAIDPDSAASMLGIVRTARLLGCRVLTTGVRPAVAQVLADIEGGDTELVSMGSLRVGVDEALRWITDGGERQDEQEPDELGEGEI